MRVGRRTRMWSERSVPLTDQLAIKSRVNGAGARYSLLQVERTYNRDLPLTSAPPLKGIHNLLRTRKQVFRDRE